MKNLTFQTVMDFCKPHNERVFKMIVDAQKSGTLSPFVGAGLSVPFGYKLWGSVLAELAAFAAEDQKKLALAQIKKCKYEEAAGTILKAYPYMLDMLPGIVDPDILKNCSDDKKKSSAAWVIPYLFRRELVMTTNFDRVLEECYQAYQNTAIPTVTPLNRDRLAQLQLNQELCLLKLHGDIGKEAVSIDDLVFTGEQYAEHYAEGTPLVSVLSQRFSSRRMLFLGCSLTVDRTMEILQKVVTAQKGIRHFAILECKKSEIPKRSAELQKLGIIPIFYDEKKHNAVRIILERLLEETDQEGYKQLRRCCRSMSAAPDEKRPLMFDSEFIPFSGRESQLETLEEFCNAKDQLLWWAVTGPGGMGKSRLVFEFCKTMEKEGWSIERFEASPSRGGNARSLGELAGWTPEVKKTVVVLDDVQAYIEPVRDWLMQMGRIHRSENLRIILLEREGKTIEDAPWLDSDFRSTHLEEWCHSEQFLQLEPLTDEQIMAVMNNYAKAAGKSLNAELLLKTLEKVDPNLKRPLYAMAIADARCQGKDPTNWDRKKILDTLLDRELDFHLDRLQGISDRKIRRSGNLPTQMTQLLADACINGVLLLDDIDWNAYPVLQKKMDEIDMDPEEFCLHLGILRTAQFHKPGIDALGNPVDDSDLVQELKVIFLTCPDLLKEHLVLKLAFEKKKMELLPEDWHNDLNRMQFLHRLWIDYPERLKDQSAFWDQFFSVTSISGLPSKLYANLLWGTTEIFPEFATKAAGILKRLYTENTDDEAIATCYAGGLFNLSLRQSTKECADTVSQLENLHRSHPDWMDITDGYARGLAHLSSLHPLEDCPDTIERLASLYHDHSDYPSLAIRYAQGLLHLSQKQSPDDRIKTVDQLDELYHSHSDLTKVADCYAEGLVHLAQSRTEENCIVAVDRSEKLYDIHPDWENIVICYAWCLAILSSVQSLGDCPTTVGRLEKLYNSHSDTIEIVVCYATGLFYLTCETTPENTAAAVEQLKILYNTHPDQREIGIIYASGLFNLSCGDTPEKTADAVDRLKTLYNTHSNWEQLAVLYAKALVNLSSGNIPETTADAVERLKTLYNTHSNWEQLAVLYARGLFNLTCGTTPENTAAAVDRLKNLYNAHFDSAEIAVLYANGLSNLMYKKAPDDYTATVERLETLYHAHPDWVEIGVIYTSELVNLALAQTTEAEVQVTLAKSEKVLQKHPDHADIQLSTAKTRFNLTLVQKEEDILGTVAQICTFLRAHSGIIPEFKAALDKYLSDHPDHTQRYQPLREL